MNTQASSAMLNGLTSQLTNSVTTSPLGFARDAAHAR